MFSVKQKRDIADAVQKIIRATNHPELPEGEIQFYLKVNGAASWSWAEIRNNGAVENPDVNPWNERQDQESEWWVIGTSLVPRWLVLEDKKTGMRGYVQNPTEAEWAEAYYSPSNPYRWNDSSRVVTQL